MLQLHCRCPTRLPPFDFAVVDEARDRCSAASHIAAVLGERAFAHLLAPPRRLTVPDVCMPYAPDAERALIPNAAAIVAAATDMMSRAGTRVGKA